MPALIKPDSKFTVHCNKSKHSFGTKIREEIIVCPALFPKNTLLKSSTEKTVFDTLGRTVYFVPKTVMAAFSKSNEKPFWFLDTSRLAITQIEIKIRLAIVKLTRKNLKACKKVFI